MQLMPAAAWDVLPYRWHMRSYFSTEIPYDVCVTRGRCLAALVVVAEDNIEGEFNRKTVTFLRLLLLNAVQDCASL
jgi:hypothetical protein